MPENSSSWPLPRLGVYPQGDGVDAAVWAGHATNVELCVLDYSDGHITGERRFPLLSRMHGVWSAHIPGVAVGSHYGFRADGQWAPQYGLRYNPNKLLVDPYARAITGNYRNVPAVRGHQAGSLEMDLNDSRDLVPHAVVTADPHQYDRPPKPGVPWEETVIYEAHVKGLTCQLPGVPPHLRGTYAGLAHPATISHLQALGVTTIELLPIHSFLDEPHLRDKGLTNYWGYNTLGFFAPHEAYATAGARSAGAEAIIAEVRGAVDLLHAAGIEVILDVVYNHSCEGGSDGPQVSLRGLDNSTYYLHGSSSPATYMDVTGCGNSLDFRRQAVAKLTLDSLRYWTEVIGVDGFRFDLAVTLGRGPYGFDPDHGFFLALAADPVLSQVKLIAEPWDVGPGGWQTGRFPLPFAEWNDQFRNTVRTFWLADPQEATHGHLGHGLRDLATRLAGSADLFGASDPPFTRRTHAAINFVTAHDGFTLADLVSYSHKNNAANGENNQDGSNDNRSWNHGIEGPVLDPSVGGEIVPHRIRSMRNLFATLVVAAGTPMITAGDELGRTQGGNNNAYCQDNEVSWVDWELSLWQRQLCQTASFLLALRREHPTLRSARFFTGQPGADGAVDLAWFGSNGHELTHAQWNDPSSQHLQMLRAWDGDATLVMFNGCLDDATFVLPPHPYGGQWRLVWDSAWNTPDEELDLDTNSRTSDLNGLSMQIFVS